MAKICTETGMQRLHARADENMSGELNAIRHTPKARQGCLVGLSSHYKAKALLAWFQDKDLLQLKQDAYTSAKLSRMTYQRGTGIWTGAFSHFMPLVSDNEALIDWHSQYISPLYRVTGGKAVRNRVGCPEYHAFQALLALQGKWDLLGKRAEYILANPPGKKMLKYQLDQEFYLALAKGDTIAMEQALATLTGPKAKIRNFDGALGLTEHLMSLFGFIYAKMAWRAGYEVQVDSPYLPMEWLPTTPLAEYTQAHDFLAEFDIYQPFEDADCVHQSPVLDKHQAIDIKLGSESVSR